MKTQFITDTNGQKLAVILPIKEYEKLLDELEELQDIKAYDQAKREDNGQRMPLANYLKKRKTTNG